MHFMYGGVLVVRLWNDFREFPWISVAVGWWNNNNNNNKCKIIANQMKERRQYDNDLCRRCDSILQRKRNHFHRILVDGRYVLLRENNKFNDIQNLSQKQPTKKGIVACSEWKANNLLTIRRQFIYASRYREKYSHSCSMFMMSPWERRHTYGSGMRKNMRWASKYTTDSEIERDETLFFVFASLTKP